MMLIVLWVCLDRMRSLDFRRGRHETSVGSSSSAPLALDPLPPRRIHHLQRREAIAQHRGGYGMQAG